MKVTTERMGRMELTVSSRRAGVGRVGFDGSVSGLVGEHGPDLERLGWVTQSVDDTELPDSGWLAGLDPEQRVRFKAARLVGRREGPTTDGCTSGGGNSRP